MQMHIEKYYLFNPQGGVLICFWHGMPQTIVFRGEEFSQTCSPSCWRPVRPEVGNTKDLPPPLKYFLAQNVTERI